MRMHIHLSSGRVLVGDDERDALDVHQNVADARSGVLEEADLQPGWLWIAGFYIDAAHVIAVTTNPEVVERPTAVLLDGRV